MSDESADVREREQRTPREHPDPATAVAAIASMYDRGEAVKREAVETATRKLAGDGDLDPETRAAVETLADRLVDGLLGPPAASLATAGDDEQVETALELFGSAGTGEETTTKGDREPAAASVGD